jgi:hypothetical protein
MPLASDWQDEGNAYLGLGIILFATVVLSQLCKKNKFNLETLKKQTVFPIMGIGLSFFLFSLSPTITFNQYKLFTYPVIPPLYRLCIIFRSTGRMTWPIIYMIITGCTYWVIKCVPKKISILLLCMLFLIQWVDLKPWFSGRGDRFKTRVTWQSELSSPEWNNLANEYKHIHFYAGFWKRTNLGFSFLNLAADHGITVNDAYLARSNDKRINDNRQSEIAYLKNNGPRDDTIYVFENESEALSTLDFSPKNIRFYTLNGVTIGLSEKKLMTLP